MIRTSDPRVWKLFRQGADCDEIDHRLLLEPGTAHDQIVAAWKADNAELAEAQRRRKHACR